MKLFGFLDTSIEDIDRIKKGRKTIHCAVLLSTIMELTYILMFFVSLWLNVSVGLSIILLMFAVYFCATSATLIIKREIYSAMIFLKEVK